MKKIFSLFVLAATLFVSSCTSYKNVPYIENSQNVDYSAATYLYDARIMPKDQLTITVVCPQDPDVTRMFNVAVQGTATGNTAQNLSTQSRLITYLVDNDGYIEYPLIGRIKVKGMTRTQLEQYIAQKVSATYTRDVPIVTVEMSNFKVSVLGEVASPCQYTVSNGKINVFEALAMARDLTIWGRRDNVKLIRESQSGEKTVVELNLQDANIINSPYYQLQQNDILYVTPNKTKAKNSGIGSETSLWFTSVSILVSVASLLYNILK